ncbi:MAG TPA: methyltransferase [Oligoflexia bacterium]|nr:methyltransferase [Oligoflexia bacterium]HMP48471.1 methyltransferase [Oligoflexia bacterium]
MGYRNHYLQIRDFLHPISPIWSNEVIQDACISISHYPRDWIESLSNLSEEELFDLSKRRAKFLSLSDSLQKTIETLTSLTIIPEFNLNTDSSNFRKLPPPASQNLTPKKLHELSRVFQFLTRKRYLPSPSPVIDFCGGAGYSARTLAHFLNTESISVDKDTDLQQRGLKRTLRFIPDQAKKILFISHDVINDNYSELINLLPKKSPIIGVHTCGKLSDIQHTLAKDLESEWTLNIGCCYYKTTGEVFQCSEFAKQHPVSHTAFSLYLAARGEENNISDFKFSCVVKKFRFMLHLFLLKEFGLNFIPVGSVPVSEYENNFEIYALGRLTILKKNGKIPYIPEIKTINHFIQDKHNIHTVQVMLACHFARLLFSRILELSVILDRALFLEEAGYHTEITELFDYDVSPRNIVLFAYRD